MKHFDKNRLFFLQICLLLTCEIGLKPSDLQAVVKPAKPWLRFEHSLQQIKISPDQKRIAYLDHPEKGQLILANLETGESHPITQHEVNSSYVFAPDGCRLFYREILKNAKTHSVISKLKAYDCYLHKTIEIAEIPNATSFINLDPKKNEILLMQNNGVITRHKVEYLENRIAKWISEQKNYKGMWIPSSGSILWVKNGSHKITKMSDDGSGVESFDISPDGSACVWASRKGEIFVSFEGQETKSIGKGRDPSWHPQRKEIVYVSPRYLGSKMVDYDIRFADMQGPKTFLFRSAYQSERWPKWDLNKNRILFTAENTTDLFEQKLP